MSPGEIGGGVVFLGSFPLSYSLIHLAAPIYSYSEHLKSLVAPAEVNFKTNCVIQYVLAMPVIGLGTHCLDMTLLASMCSTTYTSVC